MPLEVLVSGQGPRVVLVHGGVLGADVWVMQLPLSERWTLARVNRRGFGNSPPSDGEDYERDAVALLEVLEPGDHLVGYSYGGIGAMCAAAQRPDLVRSLVVIETPAASVAVDDPEVRACLRAFESFRERFSEDLPSLLRAFIEWVGPAGPLPEPFSDDLLRGADLLRTGRRLDDVALPLEALRAAPFPKLVIRGDGNVMLQRVAAVLQREMQAEMAHIGGLGHMIPFAGQPLNDVLEAFWRQAP